MGEAFDMEAPLSGWCSAFRPAGAETKSVGAINSSLVHDLSFITERKMGKGVVVVVGAQPQGETGNAMLTKLVENYSNQSGVSRYYKASPGTIVCPRVTGDGHTLWIIVNMDGKGGHVELPQSAEDMLTGTKQSAGRVILTAYQYRAFQW